MYKVCSRPGKKRVAGAGGDELMTRSKNFWEMGMPLPDRLLREQMHVQVALLLSQGLNRADTVPLQLDTRLR